MNPYTPEQWIKRQAEHAAALVDLAQRFPVIDGDELRDRCKRSAHLAMIADGTLADRLCKEPGGEFCAWAGLNPHLVGVGETEPRCRACTRNDACAQPFKVPGW